MFYARWMFLYNPPHARCPAGSGNFLCAVFRCGLVRGKTAVPDGVESGAQSFFRYFQSGAAGPGCFGRAAFEGNRGRFRSGLLRRNPRRARRGGRSFPGARFPRGGFFLMERAGFAAWEGLRNVRRPAWRLDVGEAGKRRSDGCAGSIARGAGPRLRGGVFGKRRARFFHGNGGTFGRPGNVGDCSRVSFCGGARGRVDGPDGGPQRRTSGKSGGTAVYKGSAHHPRQTSRMGREGVIKV